MHSIPDRPPNTDHPIQSVTPISEQLILHLAFTETVKIHSLNIVAPELGAFLLIYPDDLLRCVCRMLCCVVDR